MEIIFQVLSKHFPAASTVWGVHMMQFIHHVLVPETAVRLIEQDLGLDDSVADDRRNARMIKDESTRYGDIQNRV